MTMIANLYMLELASTTAKTLIRPLTDLPIRKLPKNPEALMHAHTTLKFIKTGLLSVDCEEEYSPLQSQLCGVSRWTLILEV